MAGYSGTPLAKKLGIGAGCRVFLVNAPTNYAKLVAPLPAEVEFVPALTSDTDVVHLFTTAKAQLTRALVGALKKLRKDAVIWVSWPKKSAGVATDVTENVIRDVALPLGLVDVTLGGVYECTMEWSDTPSRPPPYRRPSGNHGPLTSALNALTTRQAARCRWREYRDTRISILPSVRFRLATD